MVLISSTVFRDVTCVTSLFLCYNVYEMFLYYFLRCIMEEKQLEDYQVRFIDEYRVLSERCSKLHSMLVKYDAGTLDFSPKCSSELLSSQLEYMEGYKYILEVRAELEGIDLSEYM